MSKTNTLDTVTQSKIKRATYILEVASENICAAIVAHLADAFEASLPDLIIATGSEARDVEARLLRLCRIGLVEQHTTANFTSCYQLNQDSWQKIHRLVKVLG